MKAHYLIVGALTAWTLAACGAEVKHLDCPHWISVTPLIEGWTDACAKDIVDLGEKTIVNGIAFSCAVNPEGDPAADKAAAYAKRFTEVRPLVRQGSDVKLGILMQATMGHGGEPGSRTPWQLAVHADGKVTYRFCPMDTRFLDYIAKASRTFSDLKPDFFMVDDDTRLIWGVPGCFCPLHLAEFAKRTGRTWTREEIVAKLKAGDRDVTDRWLALKRESLAKFFRTIRDNWDPSIPGILCTVGDAEHVKNARGFAQILAAPGQVPALRGSGAPYHGNELGAIAEVRERYAIQREVVGKDIVYLQESDTCPHTRWATSATRLVNHMVMLALEGVKGAKIWITRSVPSENRSRAAYRRAFREQRGLMEWAAKVDFRQQGFVIPVVASTVQYGWLGANGDWGYRYFSRTGIPYRYGWPKADEVVALSAASVKGLTDAQLREILAGRVLLDGTAAIQLAARGFAAEIGMEAKPWTGKTIQREAFVDGRVSSRSLIAGSADLSALRPGAEIRSRLYNRPRLGADFDYVAPGSVLFTNARGGRVFTFAQALTDFRPAYYASAMYSETFRDQVVKAGRLLLGGRTPGGVSYLGDEPTMLEVGTTEKGESVFVLDNLELDADDAPELAFDRVPAAIERLQGDGSWKSVDFTCDAQGVCTLKTTVRTQEPAVFRCRHASSGRGVLCLTFDDTGFDGWTNAIPLFAKYGAHASFFPCGNLSTNALAALKALHAAGHTVGMHSLGHCDASTFFEKCCASTYWREQLDPQIKAYATVGLRPRHFAYPNNRHSEETDANLAGYFTRFRAGAPVGRTFGYYSATNTAHLADLDCAFFPAKDVRLHRVMEGVGVGEYYHTDIEDVCRGIRRAAERDEVLVIFSHAICPNATGVSMKTEWLERILAAAKECGIAIRSFDELGPVAPQQPTEPMEVVLSFDDGVKDHLLVAAPELEKRGWRGVFCVVTDWIGKGEKKLTWDDVRELMRRGHTIATHTLTHADLGGLCRRGLQERVRKEIRASCDLFEKETGVRPKILCLPGTGCHPDVIRIAREEGVVTMTVPRSCYGEWGYHAKDGIRQLREQGVKKIDFLVHGICPEGGGWKPFASKAKFVEYLDEVKAAERDGLVRVGLAGYPQ